MTNILFDKLTYIDRLTHAGVPEDQARAHADAMDVALHESVATKADVAALKVDIAAVKTEIELAVRDMTIRTGAIAVTLFAALVSIKYF